MLYFHWNDLIVIGYWQMIIAMRMLYQKAKLVHADLSEFSILYFEVSIAFTQCSLNLLYIYEGMQCYLCHPLFGRATCTSLMFLKQLNRTMFMRMNSYVEIVSMFL